MMAALRQDGVSSGAGVKAGDQVHSRRHTLGVRTTGVEGPVPDVLVDVPHPLAAPVRSDGEQRGTAVAQTKCWEPPSGDQVVAMGGGWIEALQHQRAQLSAGGPLQPVEGGFSSLLVLDPRNVVWPPPHVPSTGAGVAAALT